MNETILNETSNITQASTGSNPNEIILNLFSASSGIPLGESIIFWLIIAILGFIIYTALSMFTEFNKSVIVVFSLMPLFVVDLIKSFGLYIFHLPFLGTFELDRLVMTLSLVDWMFEFKLFDPALEIMSEYIVPESELLISNLTFTIFIDLILTLSLMPLLILFLTAAISIGDSILQFLIFFMAIYYAISIVEDKWERQFSLQVPLSLLGAIVPVIAYSFFSNPIHEFIKANAQIALLFNFMSTAPFFDIVIVILLAVLSFIIVLIIMSVMTRFFLSSSIAMFPGMQEKQWRTSFSAVAFITTIIYTFLFIMHPEYKWYLIIGVILIWKIFRHVMEDIAHEAKGRTIQREGEKKKIAMIVHEVQHPTYTERPLPKTGSGTFFTIEVILTIAGLVILFYGFLMLIVL